MATTETIEASPGANHIPLHTLPAAQTWPGTVSTGSTLNANTSTESVRDDNSAECAKQVTPRRSIWNTISSTFKQEDKNNTIKAGTSNNRSICRYLGTIVPCLNRGRQAEHDYTVRSRTINDPLSIMSLLKPIVKTFPRGYPNFAAFLDSDESFMLYRRYGYLQSRILLEKQDELRLLEEQLDELDRLEMNVRPHKLFTRMQQGDVRQGLLKKIETAFCEYGVCIRMIVQLLLTT
jgi:hypothetical protein